MGLRNKTKSDILHYLKDIISVNSSHPCPSPTVYVSILDDIAIVNMLQLAVDSMLYTNVIYHTL